MTRCTYKHFSRDADLVCCSFLRSAIETDKTVNLSENEQEREVPVAFVGSAKARGAEGHTKGALTQALVVDNFHCFLYDYDYMTY